MSSIEHGVSVIKNTIKNIEHVPGVYRMVDQHGVVLYVGKAKNLPKRITSYTQVDKLPLRLQRMVAATHAMEIITTASEVEALLLENNLIKKYKPRYNILLKDDKSYPYILLTDHPYPRVQKHRGAKTPKGDYFGPFANVLAVDEALLHLQRIFMLRNCADTIFEQRKRPCLQYHIKRCSAPCVQKILQTEYQESVESAKDFLKGKTTIVQQILSKKMGIAAEQLEYEKAALYRDQIKLLSSIQEKQLMDTSIVNNADIIGLYQYASHTMVQIFFYRYGKNYGNQSLLLSHTQDEDPQTCMSAFLNQFYAEQSLAPPHLILSHEPSDLPLIKQSLETFFKMTIKFDFPKSGVKKNLLDQAIENAKLSLQQKLATTENMRTIFQSLKDTFALESIPQRIEVYDNSHIQGSNAVGVMIVATPEGFDKKSYRKFSIREKRDFGGDDFAMMKEVLDRRFSHLSDWGMPDLLLIDGGIGQVNAVLNSLALKNLSIPVIGIAKGKERNAGKEHFIIPNKEEFQLPFNSPLLHFLQRIRDESHRFAITTHRQKRIKNISVSTLDDIPNIGPKRKKALLNHFGSLKIIKESSVEHLMQAEGISESIAQKIYDFFHD